jgi:hypothetical protein
MVLKAIEFSNTLYKFEIHKKEPERLILPSMFSILFDWQTASTLSCLGNRNYNCYHAWVENWMLEEWVCGHMCVYSDQSDRLVINYAFLRSQASILQVRIKMCYKINVCIWSWAYYQLTILLISFSLNIHFQQELLLLQWKESWTPF